MTHQDQVAIVTGGSRGIGKAIVLALAKAGAKVAFVYRSKAAEAEALVAEITALGGIAKAWQGDVADPATATTVCEGVLADWGRIDILVNNAGIIRDGLFVRMEAQAWKDVLTTNLDGTFYFCQAVSNQMVFKQRSGRIVNISSVAGTHVNAGQANYSASKGAVNSFTKVLAMEMGKRGITVNAVAPGFIETDMSEAVRNKAGDIIKKAIPVNRLGLPEDIANAVLFLCSPGASYITGQVITVDGGLSLGAAIG
jgi:3-oxoacyl-[acyl-carrier protein] reductase